MARGKHPRLITSREKIYQMTGRRIPLTRYREDGSEYVIHPKPYCSKCKVPVIYLYRIHGYRRGKGKERNERRAYECPKCGHLFKRKLVKSMVEKFNGDER